MLAVHVDLDPSLQDLLRPLMQLDRHMQQAFDLADLLCELEWRLRMHLSLGPCLWSVIASGC